jgi:hypothetical protein
MHQVIRSMHWRVALALAGFGLGAIAVLAGCGGGSGSSTPSGTVRKAVPQGWWTW